MMQRKYAQAIHVDLACPCHEHVSFDTFHCRKFLGVLFVHARPLIRRKGIAFAIENTGRPVVKCTLDLWISLVFEL
jgi:hypothetical protein